MIGRVCVGAFLGLGVLLMAGRPSQAAGTCSVANAPTLNFGSVSSTTSGTIYASASALFS